MIAAVRRLRRGFPDHELARRVSFAKDHVWFEIEVDRYFVSGLFI